MTLLLKKFTINNAAAIECYIFVSIRADGSEEFWFRGNGIAKYLHYKRPRDAIREHVKDRWKCLWKDLQQKLVNCDITEPVNWQPHTVFVSEPGLYALLTKSKKPEAEHFTEWICEEILPSLRKTGQYGVMKQENENLHNQLIKSNQALIDFGNKLEKARQDAVVLSHRFADIAQDVIAKPRREKLLHSLALHEIQDERRAVVFTRCQRRSLTNALKRLQARNPSAKELYRTGYVPNGINVLNCVKELLRDSQISYKARNNIIQLTDGLHPEELVVFVRRIVYSDDPKTESNIISIK